MRVIDHRRLELKKPKRGSRKHFVLFLLAAVIAAATYIVLKPEKSVAPVQNSTNNSDSNQEITDTAKKGTLKIFTGPQFRDLYNNFAYPNTARINEESAITGNEQADARIRNLAVIRGYQIRSAPVTDTFQDVGEGYLLQQRAAVPWLELVGAAKKDGLYGLTAAFRSAEEQRQLFNTRIRQLGIPVGEIPSGAHDGQLTRVLASTAIPGFSRHHTGYTVDISCGNTPDSAFAFTACFKWLSANNYENAKTFGWIPSYPEGTGNQGPDPEAWEYVWVGKDAVTE